MLLQNMLSLTTWPVLLLWLVCRRNVALSIIHLQIEYAIYVWQCESGHQRDTSSDCPEEVWKERPVLCLISSLVSSSPLGSGQLSVMGLVFLKKKYSFPLLLLLIILISCPVRLSYLVIWLWVIWVSPSFFALIRTFTLSLSPGSPLSSLIVGSVLRTSKYA